MTRRAAGSRHGVPKAWLFPAVALTATLGAGAVGVLSRSIVLDLIAWWPVWLGLVAAAWLLRRRTVGRVRLAGLVPLVALAALGSFLVGHIQGWTLMPSSAPALVGPPVGSTQEAELSARVDGLVEVAGGSTFLYDVAPIRRGGEVSIPDATEETSADSATIVLGPSSDGGLLSFAGLKIRISDTPTWALRLEGNLTVDLGGLTISELNLSGSGSAILGTAAGRATVLINGEFELIVPSNAAVTVFGDADVPPHWEETADGWETSGSGSGWEITVTDTSSLTVTDR